MKIYGMKLLVEVEPLDDKVGSFYMPKETVKKLNPSRVGIVSQLGDAEGFEVKVGDKIVYNSKAETVIDDTHVIIPNSAIFYVR